MSKLTAILGACVLIVSVAGSAHADDKLIKKGKKVFKKCAACHAVGPGAEKVEGKFGPHLNGIIGRKAGAVEGYEYSDGMKAKNGEGLVWTEETVSEFIKKPSAYVPGTKMAQSFKKEKKRKAVIAYLKSVAGQ